MTQKPSSKPTTLAPQQAVQDYLNTLLLDATSQAAAEELQTTLAEVVAPATVEVQPQPAALQPEVAEAPATKPQPVAAPVAEVPQTAKIAPVTQVAPVEPLVRPQIADKTDAVAESQAQAEPQPAPAADNWIDGRPPWAQQRFECLLFKVSGLLLAVPLVELGGVLRLEQELTPLFGQPDWFLGLLPSKTEGTVRVIDTARWVMPERYNEASREGLSYVVMMENSDWGMACHEVADAITLEPHQVNWRSDRGRRPWLAGTVIDHMCAIMDVAALVKLLAEQSAGAARRAGRPQL